MNDILSLKVDDKIYKGLWDGKNKIFIYDPKKELERYFRSERFSVNIGSKEYIERIPYEVNGDKYFLFSYSRPVSFGETCMLENCLGHLIRKKGEEK